MNPLTLFSQVSRINLLDLPTEILEKIVDMAREPFDFPWYRHGPDRPPLAPCKALLLIYRRRITRLRIPSSADPSHLRALFPFLHKLEHLSIPVTPDLPSLLHLLPQPQRLTDLTLETTERPLSLYDYGRSRKRSNIDMADPSVSSHYLRFNTLLPAAFWRFSSLSSLSVDSHLVSFGDPSLQSSLRQTSLEYLCLGSQLREFVKALDLLKLLTGPTKLPLLETLTLDLVSAGEGEDAHTRYDTWEMPEWYKGFERSDVELLSRCLRVSVEGTAVEALEVEDQYEKQ